MTKPPATRETLLLRVRDRADAEAWREFVAIYRPVIVRLAVRRGLQANDAERARFRTWLRRIAENAILNALSRRPREIAVGGSEFLLDPPAPSVATRAVRLEYRREVFRLVAEQVRGDFADASWRLFWRTAVEDEPIEAVAAELGLSIGAAYAARSRIMRRIRDRVELYSTDAISTEPPASTEPEDQP